VHGEEEVPMSEQDGKQIVILQKPITSDPELWKAYWKALGWPWRTEPEIDIERQKYLTERGNIAPNVEKGIYPYNDIEPKLTRADLEWLLVTHDSGHGPIDWDDESRNMHKGLDLRGADLRQLDLNHLPLARTQGGLDFEQWIHATEKQRNMASIHMEKAILKWAHLEGAYLRGAHLESALFFRAHLQDAHLDESYLGNANLNETFLGIVVLTGAKLSDESHVGPHLADIYWGSTNLATVEWQQVQMLGEEYEARKKKQSKFTKSKLIRLKEFEKAVRANRQLAVALQSQGLNEDASRFAYRAQKLQRIVLRSRKKFGQYLFSGFLDLLAGYGYRPGRSVIWYLVTIFVFALTYFAIGHLPFFPDAFVFSLTSFHGRGFFPGLGSASTLHNPLVVIAACEAVIGLVIEISFIATFTQRFFGK
ncbi:MAG TPA: pentapeptide repeat-containing protein, partial [Ktedonobacteraceae bacterium]|nr:pentapeptide repeat-containing protein [Ktedonobacteraceae bacterium]